MFRSLSLCKRATTFSFRLQSTAATQSLIHENELSKAKPFEDVPRIFSLPIIGTTWSYLPVIGKYDFRRQHLSSKQKQEQYGDIVREDLLKSNQMVHIFDMDDIEKVLRNEGKFPQRFIPNSLKRAVSEEKDFFSHLGLISTNGDDWWDLRAKVQPHMLKPRTTINYLPSIDSVAKEFVDRMGYLRNPKTLEIDGYYEEINRFTLEAVSLIALDARLGCLSRDIPLDSDAQKILDSAGKIFDLMYQLEFSKGSFSGRTYKRFKKIFREFSEVCQKYLNAAKLRLERTSKDEKDMTILELLLASKMDPKMVAIMINDIFMAGTDTTSNSTSFFLYHMTRNPGVQEKLHDEIKHLLPSEDSNITNDVLNNARFLKACVRESMRLLPVVNGVSRILSEDMVLSGYRIPKGRILALNTFLAGQSEKYFEQANKFIPERWLRENESKKTHNPFTTLPFGFGPRACIGRRIAEQELYCVLMRIFGRYRLEYHYEDIDMFTRAVNCPDKPLKFQFHDR